VCGVGCLLSQKWREHWELHLISFAEDVIQSPSRRRFSMDNQLKQPILLMLKFGNSQNDGTRTTVSIFAHFAKN